MLKGCEKIVKFLGKCCVSSITKENGEWDAAIAREEESSHCRDSEKRVILDLFDAVYLFTQRVRLAQPG